MAGFENDVVYAKNADFTQADNQSPTESNGLATNGQLWIGTTSTNVGGTHVNVGTIASTTLTVGYSSPNITVNLPGSLPAVQHLTGNSGGQLNPDGANNFNIVTANSTVTFVGSGSTLTEDFNKTNLTFGTSLPSLTAGDFNVGVGSGALNGTTSGALNVAVGYLTGTSLNSGSNNTLVGGAAGLSITTSPTNTLIGASCLQSLSTGTGVNVAVGSTSSITSGGLNVLLGSGSGSAYTSSESNNISIRAAGTVGESNTIRIGDVSHSSFYGAGISASTVAGSAPVGVASTGRLSSLGFGTSGQVLTSNGAATSPTWQATTTDGTWTPALSFGGGSTGITYDTQVGTYTKIGKIVLFSFYINLTNKGSSTGNVLVTGFPVANVFGSQVCVAEVENITYPSGVTSIFLNFNATNTNANMYGTGSANSLQQLNDTNFANNSTIRCTGVFSA